MSVLSLESPWAAATGLTGLNGFFLFGDAAATGLTGVVGADFSLVAEGVCKIKINLTFHYNHWWRCVSVHT